MKTIADRIAEIIIDKKMSWSTKTTRELADDVVLQACYEAKEIAVEFLKNPDKYAEILEDQISMLLEEELAKKIAQNNS